MPFDFLCLPYDIRERIYKLLFVRQHHVIVPTDTSLGSLKFPTQFFRTNKLICHEASQVLYSQNAFHLTYKTLEELSEFIKQIGPTDTHNIRHRHVDFMATKLKPDDVPPNGNRFAFDNDGIAQLSTLHQFSGLRTVTVILDLISIINASGLSDMVNLDFKAPGGSELTFRALEEINRHFQSVPSLQFVNIITYEVVHRDETDETDEVQKMMETFGWTFLEWDLLRNAPARTWRFRRTLATST